MFYVILHTAETAGNKNNSPDVNVETLQYNSKDDARKSMQEKFAKIAENQDINIKYIDWTESRKLIKYIYKTDNKIEYKVTILANIYHVCDNKLVYATW